MKPRSKSKAGARKRPAKAGGLSMLLALPFVGSRKPTPDNPSQRDFWHGVRSTGNYGNDCAIGSQYAYFALQAIKAENNAPALGNIVLSMIENGCPKGIAVGFFQTVADVCLGYHQIPAPDVLLAGPRAVGKGGDA
jgi:hypothetical protein